MNGLLKKARNVAGLVLLAFALGSVVTGCGGGGGSGSSSSGTSSGGGVSGSAS